MTWNFRPPVNGALASALTLGVLTACGGTTPATNPPPSGTLTLFADPAAGDDANPGTRARPLKTLGRALALSATGSARTVTLLPGTYDEASGETWQDYEVPDGVTVRANSSGVVLAGGADKEALRFAGAGELRYLSFKGFGLTLRAQGGKQMLVGLTFEGKRGLSWAGDAAATLQDCVFQTSEVALWASYTSSFDLSGGKLAGGGNNLIVQQLAKASLKNAEISGGSIDVNQSGTLSLENVKLSNVGSYAVYARAGNPSLFVKGGSFTNSSAQASVIYGQGANIVVEGAIFSSVGTALGATESSVVIRDSTISNSKSYGLTIGKGSSLRMRGSRVVGSSSGGNAVGISVGEGAGSIDLGTASDPGGNTLQDNGSTSLAISGASGIVQAVGNTWQPGEQGADAAGHYASAVSTPVGPYGYNSGKNFYVKYPYSIQF